MIWKPWLRWFHTNIFALSNYPGIILLWLVVYFQDRHFYFIEDSLYIYWFVILWDQTSGNKRNVIIRYISLLHSKFNRTHVFLCLQLDKKKISYTPAVIKAKIFLDASYGGSTKTIHFLVEGRIWANKAKKTRREVHLMLLFLLSTHAKLHRSYFPM